MTEALRTLLAGLIDYAGLFPPAALDMAEAARNYEAYRAGPHSWALGRFIVPSARLSEVDPDVELQRARRSAARGAGVRDQGGTRRRCRADAGDCSPRA